LIRALRVIAPSALLLELVAMRQYERWLANSGITVEDHCDVAGVPITRRTLVAFEALDHCDLSLHAPDLGQQR
jgi:hypothetical protein